MKARFFTTLALLAASASLAPTAKGVELFSVQIHDDTHFFNPGDSFPTHTIVDDSKDGATGAMLSGTTVFASGLLNPGGTPMLFSGRLTCGPNAASGLITNNAGWRAEAKGSTATYTNEWFGMDPTEAGAAAIIHYVIHTTDSVVNNGAGVHASMSAYFPVEGFNFTNYNFSAAGVPNQINGSRDYVGDTTVPFGSPLYISLTASATAGSGGSTAGTGSASLTTTLDYTVTITEERIHWKNETGGAANTAANWMEEMVPGATQYATFNRGVNPTYTVTLDTDRSTRGIIADGNNPTLNLGGRTLSLTSAGGSLKPYNILIGEGYNSETALTLRNGIVDAELNVHVGFDNGFLTFIDPDFIPFINTGTLNVHDGARLTTLGMVQLSNEEFTAGVLDIKGVGSKVAAASVRIGRFGVGTATVRDAAEMSAGALELAKELGSTGTLNITGPGSKLTLSDSVVSIGQHGRGEVTVRGGASADWGGGSTVTIGDTTSHFSEVRIEGTGTTSSGASFLIKNGAVLDVRDKANLTSRSATGLVKVNEGGTFRVMDATVDVESMVVDGGFATFTNHADVTLQSLTLPSHSTLQVTGTGTKLRVNGNFILGAGNLQVGSGAEFFAHQLLLASDAYLHGVGTLHCDQVVHPNGSISPGFSPGILTLDGDYAQSITGLIEIEICGPLAGVDHDQLIVTGDAVLNGIVVLKFINGYAPVAGQQFNIIDTGGTFSGNPRIIVQGLAPGWQFTTGFNALTGEFRINSTNNGTAGDPPGTDLDNLDGDADSNFMEFAFGTDMAVNDSGVMVVSGNTLIRRGSPTLIVDGSNNRALFCRRKDRTNIGLGYTAQFSADLVTWQDSTATPVILADDGDYEAVSVTFPATIAGQPARFFRLALTTL